MFEEPGDEGNCQVCKIAKVVGRALNNGGTVKDDSGAGTDTKKSKSGEEATFGNKGKKQYGRSRG